MYLFKNPLVWFVAILGLAIFGEYLREKYQAWREARMLVRPMATYIPRLGPEQDITNVVFNPRFF